jgi:hypothetical protein
MAVVESTPVPPPAPRRCENCGVPLLGDHCHSCGQPTKGLVRHFTSVMGDFLDTVFNIDSRVLRTLGPLLTRPGWLSLEYFAGRRVRYVTPMRLFLFLSLLAFFAIQARIEVGDDEVVKFGPQKEKVEANSTSIDKAGTAAEVEAARKDALAEFARARKQLNGVPGGAAGVAGLEVAEQKINEAAKQRTRWLAEAADAKAKGLPEPPASGKRSGAGSMNFNVHDKPWDPVSNPIDFAWLPAFVNHSLNRRFAHAREALEAKDGERTLMQAMFNVLPQTLIVLMPIFALMLKLAYLFKRRLYMEHLIVALHSHAFIALALTLVMAFSGLQDWLAPTAGFWNSLLGWAIALTSIWIPVYLLLMQKRVYGQGWIMTLLKFSVLGVCYSVLLGLALITAVLVGLLTL